MLYEVLTERIALSGVPVDMDVVHVDDRLLLHDDVVHVARAAPARPARMAAEARRSPPRDERPVARSPSTLIYACGRGMLHAGDIHGHQATLEGPGVTIFF